MAANLEKLAEQYPSLGQLGLADTLIGLAQVSRQLGIETLPDYLTSKGSSIPVEVKPFSDEARETLISEGYKIYPPGNKFWSAWHQDHPDFEAKQSRLSEVAIHPEQLFLPNSNNKTLEQQLKLVEKFSKQLCGRERLSGVRVVVGEAPDYAEVAFAHLKATGQYLFGQNYGYRYTRTQTPTVGSSVAIVGDFDAQNGLSVHVWNCDDGGVNVWVVPLVVPA